MIDITKQRKIETTVRKPPVVAPAVPSQVITNTITRQAQPLVAPVRDMTNETAALESIHGPGGARDPFAGDSDAPIEEVLTGQAKIHGPGGARDPFAGDEPTYLPAEPLYPGETGQEQAAQDALENVERVDVSPGTQAVLDKMQIDAYAAEFADARATLLEDAGLDERGLAALVRINPNKTEEEIIAINLAKSKTWQGSLQKLVGRDYALAKTQIAEAGAGRGEHVLPGLGGNAEGPDQELNGTERTIKVLQAVAMPVLGLVGNAVSYVTGIGAQNDILRGPVGPRYLRKMAEAGLDPNGTDHTNQRLELVTETLLEAYHSTSASGFAEGTAESNHAAIILVARGYLEIVNPVSGGVIPGVVGIAKAPFKLTGAGIALARNTARAAKRASAFKAASTALRSSGGLERRLGEPGAPGVPSNVSQRLMAVAAAGSDESVTRIGALAQRIATREAVAVARVEAERMVNRDAIIGTDVVKGKYVPAEGNKPSRLRDFLNSEESGPEPISALARAASDVRVSKGPEGLRVGKIVIGLGPEGLPGGMVKNAGGYFDDVSGDFVITPQTFKGNPAGKRMAVSTVVHELTHVGQWLKSNRNSELFHGNADLERLPSAVQEVVLKMLGVTREVLEGDPNVRALFASRGVRGQIADALRKFADEDRGGKLSEVQPSRPKTTLTRYADNSQMKRLSWQLNELRGKRMRSGITLGPSPKEQVIKKRIDDLFAQENSGTGQTLGQRISPPGAPGDGPRPSTSGEHADEVYRLTMDDPGNIGATYSLRKGDMSGEDAWSVGSYPERMVEITGRDVTPGDLERFIAANEDILKRDDLSVGTYKDPDTGVTMLDIVKTPSVEKFLTHTIGTVKGKFPGERVPDAKAQLRNARQLAKQQAIQIAKESGQDSIYNLRTGKTVKTPRTFAQDTDIASIVTRIRAKGTPELFKKAAKWYTEAGEFARAMSRDADFAPTSVPHRNVAVAMAALSPQNQWTGAGKMDNLKAIYKMIRAYERGDKTPFEFEEGMNLSGDAARKAWRALTSKGDPMDELVGAKERSFALNLLGEKDMATIDSHIGKGGFGVKNPKRLSPAEHARIQAAYESALAELKSGGQVPEDFAIRDLQAADWGIISQNELDFWTPQAEKGTMFPGTAADALPYDVTPGVGETEPRVYQTFRQPEAHPSDRQPSGGQEDEALYHSSGPSLEDDIADLEELLKSTSVTPETRARTQRNLDSLYADRAAARGPQPLAGAPGEQRSRMGGLASKAFEKYNSVGDVVRLIKTTGFNGIADFSKAVMDGDPRLIDAPDQLIEDFAYGHVERGAIGLWDKTEDIERIVKNYVKFIKSGRKMDINDIITEEATGVPRGNGPTAAAPGSDLSRGNGQGQPKLEVGPDSPYGFGGISGLGTGTHGIAGDPNVPVFGTDFTTVLEGQLQAAGRRTVTEDPLAGNLLGLKTGSGLPVKPSKAGVAEDVEQGAEQGVLAGPKLMGAGTKAPIEGSHNVALGNAIKSLNDIERAGMATGDNSFIGNQGWSLILLHPKEARHMITASLKSMASRKGLARANQAVNALPTHNLAVRVGLAFDSGPTLGISDEILAGRSEFFQSAVVEHLGDIGIPGGKVVGDVLGLGGVARVASGLVRSSARAYAGAGNTARGRLFDTFANGWDLLTPAGTIGSRELAKQWKLTQDLRDYTQILTGIGDISSLPKLLQDIGPAFFAYKFFASKFNFLFAPMTYTTQAMRGSLPSRIGAGAGMPTPLYLAPEHASSWRMAALAWRDLSLYAGEVAVSASLLKMLGVDVGIDPNQESKFLQITFGEGDEAFQFDMTGGLAKVFSLLYQTAPLIGSGVHKTRSGKMYKLSEAHEAPFQQDSLELWETFLKGKLGPVYSQALMAGRQINYMGKPTTLWDLIPLPIGVKNAIEMIGFSETYRNSPEMWAKAGLILTSQFFGLHGYTRDTKSQPPGFLGAPMKDLFEDSKPKRIRVPL